MPAWCRLAARCSRDESEFLSRLGGRVRNAGALVEMLRRDLARRSGIFERYIAQI
jgi:hypothetical protein